MTLGPITILKRPKTTAETVAEIRTHIAAVDALLNGLSLDCNVADGHREDGLANLTVVLDCVETTLRYESEYQDEQENVRERDAVHPFLRSEKYP
jgi:hypothetical protein